MERPVESPDTAGACPRYASGFHIYIEKLPENDAVKPKEAKPRDPAVISFSL
jgi:hypothetical protein